MGRLLLDPGGFSQPEGIPSGSARPLPRSLRALRLDGAGQQTQRVGNGPPFPTRCSHRAQGPGQRCVNPFLSCSAGGPGGIRCGAHVGSPAGTGVRRNWADPSSGVTPCAPGGGVWSASPRAQRSSGQGEPQEAYPRAALVSQGGPRLSSGHSAGGTASRITVPENRTWEQVPAVDPQAARGKRAGAARWENLLQTPSWAARGSGSLHGAISLLARREHKSERSGSRLKAPQHILGRAPRGDLEKGISFCTPCSRDEGCARHPTAPEGPSASPRWARLAPPWGAQSRCTDTWAPCVPADAGRAARPAQGPSSQAPSAGGRWGALWNRQPGPRRRTAQRPRVPSGLERRSLQLRAGRGAARGGVGVERGPFLRGSGVGTCPHGAHRLAGTKNPGADGGSRPSPAPRSLP